MGACSRLFRIGTRTRAVFRRRRKRGERQKNNMAEDVVECIYLNPHDNPEIQVDGLQTFSDPDGNVYHFHVDSTDMNSKSSIKKITMDDGHTVSLRLVKKTTNHTDTSDVERTTKEQPAQSKILDPWNEASTMLLLSEFQKKRRLIQQRQIPSLRIMWQMISEIMIQEGFNFTAMQIENRWKTLVRSYRRLIKNNRTQSKGKRKRFLFQKEIEEIVKEHPYLMPSDLQPQDEMSPEEVSEDVSTQPDMPLSTSPVSDQDHLYTHDMYLNKKKPAIFKKENAICGTPEESAMLEMSDIPILTSCSESDSAVAFADGIREESESSFTEEFVRFREELEKMHKEKEAAKERRHQEKEVAKERRHTEKMQILQKFVELLS